MNRDLLPLETEARQRQPVVWLVTRHPGALEWARARAIPFDRHVRHLELGLVHSGDTVIGSLPVHRVAQLTARGARFLSLSVDVPAGVRGCELSAGEMDRFGARLERIEAWRVE